MKNRFYISGVITAVMVLSGCSKTYNVETNIAPEGWIDYVKQNGSIIIVAGWSADPENGMPAKVDIYIDRKKVFTGTKSMFSIERPDVASVYGGQKKYLKTGWTVSFIHSLQPGSYNIYAIAYDNKGAVFQLNCKNPRFSIQ